MRSFIIKVTGITLLAILTVAAITYASFAIFSPSSLATFYDGVGNYDRAVSYAYGQYERTGDKEDLLTVCRYALKTYDDKKIERYLSLLVDDGFYSYCTEDERLGEDFYTFITGKLAVSAYRNETRKENAVDMADDLTESYSETCALRAVLFEAVKEENEVQIGYLKEKLSLRNETAAGEEKELIEYDLYNIDEFLK